MPRSEYYQKHKQELLLKQKERRKKEKEERDRKRGISFEDLLKQKREEREREDPWYDLKDSGANPWG
jgi:hypothetical protein